MALPMIAAGIAARTVAKKLASRAAGGITGAGAKQVNPVYKEMGLSKATAKATAKANARGLKAANKPVSKNNRGQTASQFKTDILKNATPARPNRVRGGSMKSKLNFPKGM
jgi:hypothetical protein